MPSNDCFTFSEHEGLFEICADLGVQVKKGAIIAKVWAAERTGAVPAEYYAKSTKSSPRAIFGPDQDEQFWQLFPFLVDILALSAIDWCPDFMRNHGFSN